jgi:mRNA-degrading endonuclease RelE of RelBE toxin-antitoxin system
MNFKIETLPNFEKEAKRLINKYNSLKKEIRELIDSLEQNPNQGIHLGNNVYKIRLAIKSKSRGKSGGARVITQVKVVNQTVYLFSIYDKGEKENISDNEIKDLIKNVPA